MTNYKSKNEVEFAFNKKCMQSMAYLFTVDVIHLLANTQSIAQFEEREKGYAISWLEAISDAIQHKKKPRQITHEFIQSINMIALSHLDSNKMGVYKDSANNFKLSVGETHSKGFLYINETATLNGLCEFIERSLIEDKKSTLFIEFSKDKYSYVLYGNEGSLYLLEYIDDSKIMSHKNIELDQDLKDLMTAKIKEKYQFYLQAGTEFAFAKKIYSSVQESVKEKMQEIFNSYATVIEKCNTNREKVTVIGEHIQRISQLHPFQDGNTRTCYALMQALLNEEGLLLSLMIDPNRLDMLSREELADEIEEGQRAFLSLASGNHPKFRDVVFEHVNEFLTEKLTEYLIPNGKEAMQKFALVAKNNIEKIKQKTS